MKKVVVLLLVFVVFGCQKYKKEAERLQAVQDSITVVTEAKDSAIVGFLMDFNEIQAGLDSLKDLEKLLTVDGMVDLEKSSSKKDKIFSDIQLLYDLNGRNKEKIVMLQGKLRNSNGKIKKLESVISEFEKMVLVLTAQIEEKDNEIANLNLKISGLSSDINALNNKYEQAMEESREKAKTIDSQVVKLNTAYFVFGSVKELIENNVIEKQGGVLGLGRTVKLKQNFNKDYFTLVNISEFEYLPLMMKKANVITTHLVDSYHITGEKSADTLFVDNNIEFWKASKYLVVVGN
jgi:predicted RNase H-like nuclease (RuvC/YqgF family)